MMRLFDTAWLSSKIRIGIDIWRQLGGKTFFGRVLPWLFCRRYYFYSQPIHSTWPALSCSCPVVVKFADDNDLALVAALSPGDATVSELKKRLRDGHLCFTGWLNDKLVHFRWIFTRCLYLPYLHRTLLLSSFEVYVDETYTLPELRGRGIAAYTGRLLRLALFERGFKRYSCAVASWNKAQQKLTEKFGMEKVGEGGFIDFLLGKRFIWKGRVKDHGDGRIEICVPE
ncbi:MAG: GNAT family N-acetyltransferase [Clostridiales bacterium]|nr:GNAT family N-acetyltransferase [Clostridiales bacterium]